MHVDKLMQQAISLSAIKYVYKLTKYFIAEILKVIIFSSKNSINFSFILLEYKSLFLDCGNFNEFYYLYA